MNQVIPMVVGMVVSTSVSVAFEAATKIATPAGVKAVSGFLIKGASFVIGGIISSKIASLAVENTEAILETVKNTPAAVEPTGNDN